MAKATCTSRLPPVRGRRKETRKFYPLVLFGFFLFRALVLSLRLCRFLALHFIQQLLLSNKRATVLFVAKNLPLALFVAKWLVTRDHVKGAASRRRLLGRLHLLSEPVDGEPCVPMAVTLVVGADGETALVAAAPKTEVSKYDLLVVDEAHHVYKDAAFRSAVEKIAADRRMLLSDVSQGLGGDTEFPSGLQVVTLTEVVRSSERIVAGAMQFQLLGALKLLTKCHNESEGPPLKSILFSLAEMTGSIDELYAMHTTRALRHIITDFPDLSLHDQLAIVVPDAAFRSRLAPLLERRLADAFPERKFELVSAAKACASCAIADKRRGVGESEWLVLDGVTQVRTKPTQVCCLKLNLITRSNISVAQSVAACNIRFISPWTT